MNLTSLILLICVCVNAGLGIFVFWRRHSRPVHFIFAALVFAIALWNLSHFMVSLAHDPAVLNTVGRCAFIFGAVCGTCYLMLTWYFPEGSHATPSRFTVAGVLTSAAGVIAISATPLVQAGVTLTAAGKGPVFGLLAPVYVAYVVAVCGWATWNLLWSRMQAPSGRERMQLNYSLAGFVISIAIVCITQFGLPLWAPMSDYYLLGGTATLAWSLLTFHALTRHRLMDIGVAFRNVLIKVLLGAVLTLLVVLPFAINQLGQMETPIVTEMLIIVIIVAGLAIYLPEVQNGITKFVDQRLFRGRYDHETALVQFGDRLLRTYGREEIAALIAKEIPIIIQADGAAVYLPAEDGADYVLASPFGIEGARGPENLPAGDPLLAAALQARRRLIKDEIAYGQPRPERADEILRTFEQLAATVAWPLLCQNRLLGLLLLGEKRQDNVFTSDDLDLLNALAAQAAVALDNTRLYEQAIAAKTHYEIMLRHMQRGVLTVDTSLRIVTLNDMGAAILGVAGPDCIGRPIHDVVPEFSDLVTATFANRADQPVMEIPLPLAKGSIPCECETSLMLDARHRLTGAMLVFQDLTEKKRFQEEVRRMDRLASVGTLAAGIAHEIKNPLVSIQTFAQLLPDRYQDISFREGFGAIVRDEVSRINKLVHSLLEFARPRPRQIGPVSVHELLDRALTLLDSELHKHEIEVCRAYGAEVPIISGDREQLFQVFFNLIQNAIQAMDGVDRQIVLSTATTVANLGPHPTDAVRLTIHDTGQGIDAEHISHIFDPFFSTKSNGSGLGLSICHTIIEEHGARIAVESTPEKGTTFSLTLPVKARAVGATAPKIKEPSCRV